MANPNIPATTTVPVPPLAPNFPIVDERGCPSVQFFQWCQFVWAALQGGGGVFDVVSLLSMQNQGEGPFVQEPDLVSVQGETCCASGSSQADGLLLEGSVTSFSEVETQLLILTGEVNRLADEINTISVLGLTVYVPPSNAASYPINLGNSSQVTGILGAGNGGTGSNAAFTASGNMSMAGALTVGNITPAGAGVALGIYSTTGCLILPSMTTTQRNAISASSPMVIYNNSFGEYQAYKGGAWGNITVV